MVEAKILKGSELLTVFCNKNQMEFHQIAQITEWRVVSPAEYKIKYMAEQAIELSKKPRSEPRDPENCAICQCPIISDKLIKMDLD